MPTELHKRLKQAALTRGVTISEAVIQAIEAWVDGGEKAAQAAGSSTPVPTVADPAQALWATKLRYILDRGALNQITGIQLAIDTFEALIREREKRGRVNTSD